MIGNKWIVLIFFSDYGIEYRDKEKQITVRWDLIKKYTVFQGFIHIYLKNNLQATFIVSDQEIIKDDYDRILIILKDKMSLPGKRLVESNINL